MLVTALTRVSVSRLTVRVTAEPDVSPLRFIVKPVSPVASLVTLFDNEVYLVPLIVRTALEPIV